MQTESFFALICFFGGEFVCVCYVVCVRVCLICVCLYVCLCLCVPVSVCFRDARHHRADTQMIPSLVVRFSHSAGATEGSSSSQETLRIPGWVWTEMAALSMSLSWFASSPFLLKFICFLFVFLTITLI